jgi:transcriptional regulator with XRE-family HTH domain
MGNGERAANQRRQRPAPPWRVFLSHTSDLREVPTGRSFVSAAEASVIRAGHVPTDMAYFTARDAEPENYCRTMVAEADVYIGIIGFRYGSLARDQLHRSYTELEYEAAIAEGLPRLLFLVREGSPHSLPITQPDEHSLRQHAFRRRLLNEAGVTVAWVETAADVEIGVFQALIELRYGGTSSQQQSDSYQRYELTARLSEMPDGTIAASFPDRLRKLRGQHRSQEEMAEAVGVTISTYRRWEAGKTRPHPRQVRGLCRVLAVDESQLGLDARSATSSAPAAGPTSEAMVWTPADGYSELVARVEVARSLGADLIDTFNQQTDLLRSLDRQLGAASVAEQMRGHLATLEDALTFVVRPDIRVPTARALAGAATLGAWQSLDGGALDKAWRLYELAKRAAAEAGDPMLLTHAMGEQAYVLSDAGQANYAVDMLHQARRMSGKKVSPRLAAWLFAAEAELCAKAGRSGDCYRALENAARYLPAGDEARDPDMPSIFLNGAHLARWSGNALALLGDAGAMDNLYTALDAMDSTFMRATAGIHCDLAQAHLARGESPLAREHLGKALAISKQTGSARHFRRVDLLSRRLQ